MVSETVMYQATKFLPTADSVLFKTNADVKVWAQPEPYAV